jgi:S-adenosylmethionine-diacylglycerol 3-amino-3-carboxypropyl transferase
MSRIDTRADFGILRYANSWEDADVLCEALQPAPGKRILAIASAGDNAFALAAEGAEVLAVDLSAAQLALVELKRAAIRQLDNPGVLAFLGITPDAHRVATYNRLELPDGVRAFWDGRLDAIEGGVGHAGRFENYFRLFRTYVLPLVHSRHDVAALLQPRNENERRHFYAQQWNTWRWRLMFRVFFSRLVMGRTGRDPEFFRYVEGSVAQRIFERAEYAMTVLDPRTNPYLTFILTGSYRDHLPRYLRNLDATRSNLHRVTTARGSIDEAATGAFDGFYLSDIFEYVDRVTHEAMVGRLLSMANRGARLAYWNLLVPRSLPSRFSSLAEPMTGLGASLFARDQAFFYSAFMVDEVR